MKLQWYPGHMTKAVRQMQSDIKLVDLVIELRDARAVLSSYNPDIDSLAAQKFRLILLNKADLADEGTTNAWIRYFNQRGISAIALDSRSKGRNKLIQQTIDEVCREKFERDKRRGILNRPVRAMVVGIPNVGKSTFINSFAGKAAAKTGNKPGVTKGNQWIRLNSKTELLDTPGLLWPKFEEESVGTHLAFLGSVNDDIIDTEEMAYELIRELSAIDPELLTAKYQIEADPDANVMIERIGLKRNCLRKGGEADRLKASRMLIEDFRNGRIGRISLEQPPEDTAHA